MDEANEAYEERLAEQRQKRLAEEAVMRQDAERYRYLRKHHVREHHVREWKSNMPHDKGAPSLDLDFSAEGHDLDAAIDRAMKGANARHKPRAEGSSA